MIKTLVFYAPEAYAFVSNITLNNKKGKELKRWLCLK
jgi:hypothetical protein